jgi:hypothetical protein
MAKKKENVFTPYWIQNAGHNDIEEDFWESYQEKLNLFLDFAEEQKKKIKEVKPEKKGIFSSFS